MQQNFPLKRKFHGGRNCSYPEWRVILNCAAGWMIAMRMERKTFCDVGVHKEPGIGYW